MYNIRLRELHHTAHVQYQRTTPHNICTTSKNYTTQHMYNSRELHHTAYVQQQRTTPHSICTTAENYIHHTAALQLTKSLHLLPVRPDVHEHHGLPVVLSHFSQLLEYKNAYVYNTAPMLHHVTSRYIAP